MAFADIVNGMRLPLGATDRYRKLEGFRRQLTSSFYDDLRYQFEDEKDSSGNHINIRDRRPSVIYNLPHVIVSQTQAELFGDEQFPLVRIKTGKDLNVPAGDAIHDLIEENDIQQVVFDAYYEGSCGAVAVIVRRGDDGKAFYEIIPGKFAEPVYAGPTSKTLAALIVTYPIDAKTADKLGDVDVDKDAAQHYWYRYALDLNDEIDYVPLPDFEFAKLGEQRTDGSTIEFVEKKRRPHGFRGRVNAVYTRNRIGWTREIDGPASWAEVVDLCVELDYTYSQCGRGLRYSADPMLFIRRGDLMSQSDVPAGYEPPAGGMATNTGADGSMVKGVTQTLVGGSGSDAKLLEISANGIKEEREFARDLREAAMEVLGGMKASAENEKSAMSGKAMQQMRKPLRLLIRRQRRPYGNGLLISLLELTVYGISAGAIYCDTDIAAVPEDAQWSLEWPSEEIPQGVDLLATAQALQIAMGRPLTSPGNLMAPEDAQARWANEIGLHDPATVPESPDLPTPGDTGTSDAAGDAAGAT